MRDAGPQSLFLILTKLQGYRTCLWVFPGICLEKVDKRIQQREEKGLDVDIIQPSAHGAFHCWLINLALVFSFIFIWGGQIVTESMSGQGRLEEGADCSAAVADGSEVCCVLDGWVCSLCVCTVYISADCQTLYMETGRVYDWIQEMTMNMPNVPVASVLCGDGYGM